MKTTYTSREVEHSKVTIIEYRDNSGRLNDAVFDEPEFFIQDKIDSYKEKGYTDIKIVKNPHNFNLKV